MKQLVCRPGYLVPSRMVHTSCDLRCVRRLPRWRERSSVWRRREGAEGEGTVKNWLSRTTLPDQALSFEARASAPDAARNVRCLYAGKVARQKKPAEFPLAGCQTQPGSESKLDDPILYQPFSTVSAFQAR